MHARGNRAACAAPPTWKFCMVARPVRGAAVRAWPAFPSRCCCSAADSRALMAARATSRCCVKWQPGWQRQGLSIRMHAATGYCL